MFCSCGWNILRPQNFPLIAKCDPCKYLCETQFFTAKSQPETGGIGPLPCFLYRKNTGKVTREAISGRAAPEVFNLLR
jgi:hypothetical protein